MPFKNIYIKTFLVAFINFACQVFFVTSRPRNQAYFCGKHGPKKVYGWSKKCWPKLCLLKYVGLKIKVRRDIYDVTH